MLKWERSACTRPFLYSFFIILIISPKNSFGFFGGISLSFGAGSTMSSITSMLNLIAIGLGTLMPISLALRRFLNSRWAQAKIISRRLFFRCWYLGSYLI